MVVALGVGGDTISSITTEKYSHYKSNELILQIITLNKKAACLQSFLMLKQI
jgi:hypothetical protein